MCSCIEPKLDCLSCWHPGYIPCSVHQTKLHLKVQHIRILINLILKKQQHTVLVCATVNDPATVCSVVSLGDFVGSRPVCIHCRLLSPVPLSAVLVPLYQHHTLPAFANKPPVED